MVMGSRLTNMFDEHLASVLKGLLGGEPDQEFRLTNFDIHEVSTVDRGANKKEFLVVKGQGMSDKALLELIGNGNGEFVNKLTDKSTTDKGTALKLSKTMKAEALQNLGTVVKGLIAVAQQIDKAEEADDGATELPENLTAVVEGSHEMLSKMLGKSRADDVGAGDNADNKSGDQLTQFGKDLNGLSTVLSDLQTHLTKSDFAGAGDASGAVDTQITKILATLATSVEKQGAALTQLTNRVGLPAAARPDTEVTKSDDVDAWGSGMDMNQKPRPDAQF